MSERAACSVTHEQLINGDCPWCRHFLDGSNDRTSSEPPPQRRWNYALMLRVTLNGDKEQKILTLSNIARDSDDLIAALPVLRACLQDPLADISDLAESAMITFARKLSDEEASRL